jgi:hypothetical protein
MFCKIRVAQNPLPLDFSKTELESIKSKPLDILVKNFSTETTTSLGARTPNDFNLILFDPPL